jgi:microcystin-dependent protein
VSDPFVAEIRMVGFGFAPTGWATCDGQLLPISQNTALFSLIGTYYGGDGKSTFALPNLAGSSPMHWNQGPGLSNYDLGQVGGSDSVTLLATEDAVHSHGMTASGSPPSTLDPANMVLGSTTNAMYMPTGNTALDPGVLKAFGGGAPHNNRQPYLTMLFIIAMQGIFPQRP